jgi:hypothetical protein
MELINSILDSCIVEDESSCLRSAEELVARVDDTMVVLQRGGQLLKEGGLRQCRICGRGIYQMLFGRRGAKDRLLIAADKDVLAGNSVEVVRNPDAGQTLTVRIFACDVCGHLELFHFGEGPLLPVAWR